MDFETTLTYQFTQLGVFYRNFLQKTMNEIGLHSGQIFVLISLWKTDGQSQIDLVKNLSLSPPTINKMIKGLVISRFIETQKCAVDGRMVRVYLTDKGRQLRNLTEEKWISHETESFSTLTETEKLLLLHLFEKLRENSNIQSVPKSDDL